MVPEKILVGIIYGVFPLETALTRGLKIIKRKFSTESEMVVETLSTRQMALSFPRLEGTRW
jgi:hypothetical protein